MSKSTPYIAITVVMIIILVIAGLVFYYMDVHKKGFFAPYTPTPLKNGYQPYGKVTKLSPETMKKKNAIIKRSKAELAAERKTNEQQFIHKIFKHNFNKNEKMDNHDLFEYWIDILK